MRRRRRLVRGLALAAALLVAGGALLAAAWVYDALHTPYAAWRGPHADVLLEPGLDARAMLERLSRAGVVRDPGLVRRWLALRGGGDALLAGEYRFDRPHTPIEVIARLRRGDVLMHTVTVPEGLVLEEVARRLAEGGLWSPHELLAAFRDPRSVRDLDPRAADLEGYLFPETYRFARGATPEEVARAMVGRFRAETGADFAARARAVGLDVRRAVILASMIERETSVPGERARISRVFHNRLRRGMRMQCDPTVLYALQRAGRRVERLSAGHLDFASPWNTYLVPGLPPGPIANPGRASLEAAVDPAPGDELFFVAAPGGGHRFSSSLDAHNAAVADWRDYARSSR